MPPSSSGGALARSTSQRRISTTLSRLIRATLTLTADPAAAGIALAEQSETVTLLAPVDLLPLELPTALVLFRHTSFAPTASATLPRNRPGAALFLVPTSSALAD